jgi:hypothetical protein
MDVNVFECDYTLMQLSMDVIVLRSDRQFDAIAIEYGS